MCIFPFLRLKTESSDQDIKLTHREKCGNVFCNTDLEITVPSGRAQPSAAALSLYRPAVQKSDLPWEGEVRHNCLIQRGSPITSTSQHLAQSQCSPCSLVLNK